jgi:hypothetical protein
MCIWYSIKNIIVKHYDYIFLTLVAVAVALAGAVVTITIISKLINTTSY